MGSAASTLGKLDSSKLNLVMKNDGVLRACLGAIRLQPMGDAMQ
jgi:hypothetical protein